MIIIGGGVCALEVDSMVVDGLHILSYNDGNSPPQLQCWWVYDNTTDTPESCVLKTHDTHCSPQMKNGKLNPVPIKKIDQKH